MWLICHIWSTKELCNIMYHKVSNGVLLNINISVFLLFKTFGQDKKGTGDVEFITSRTFGLSRIYYSIKWRFRQNVEEDVCFGVIVTLWPCEYPPPTFLLECPPETVRPHIATPVSLMGSGFGLPGADPPESAGAAAARGRSALSRLPCAKWWMRWGGLPTLVTS